MTVPKVGDVVAWDKVPSGALVRTRGGAFNVQVSGRGTVVATTYSREHSLSPWSEWVGKWPWGSTDESVTIVALGLTGQETAADLQRMAEVFEVREAIMGEDSLMDAVAGRLSEMVAGGMSYRDAEAALPGDLYRLGWRAGDSAEDAARLLAAAGK